MVQNNEIRNISSGSSNAQFAEVSAVYKNIAQEVIITTEDKISICLTEHLKLVERKRDWMAPLGISLTILAVLVTANFTEITFGLDPKFWQAVFVLIFGASIVWLIKSLINFSKAGEIEDIIKKLKQGSQGDTESRSKKEEMLFEIESAFYGSDKSDKEVTSILKELIKNNKLNVTVSNDIAGDPDVGVKKTMRISYKFNGLLITKEFEEGEEVNLP